jgi:uncharacterized protein (DUF885 family)
MRSARRRFALALTAAVGATLAASGCSQPPAEPAVDPETVAADLDGLFEQYFEESMERNPLLGTFIGDPRYNAGMPNFLSPEYIAEQEAFDRRWLETVQAVDREALSGQDRLSYDIFVYERETALEGARFPGELIPLDQFSSFPSFFAQMGSGQSVQPFRSEKDYRDFLVRIDDAVVLFDQAVTNMRLGMARGIVQPRPLMEKVLPQLEAHLVERPEDSVFYAPVAQFPDEVPEAVREELRAAYAEAIRTKLVPVYGRALEFVRDEYLAACRDSIALTALPDGEAWYAYRVKTQTTSAMRPEEIHQFGLDEVARITGEMEQVMREVGFEGSLQEFFTHLESEERFYYTDAEALLEGYRDLQETINATLPAAFDIFPEADYEVREVPEFMRQSAAGASYQPAAPDGSRPGVFYVNTFNLKAQPRFGMETLSLHEASPGHHFQISIAQEIEELPRFRRFGGQTAFFEGWALYAESLGKELGLFTDPYSYYGRLGDEMLRAMRLVVDTGMHAKGWSREQAIEYMLEHSSMAETDVVSEVERYIAIPGQALAYKVGQREISALRADAEQRLGERFDVKAFHRAVLTDGALPLQVLRRKMEEWIASHEA